MHISVVVPFYNAEKYIGACIEALLLQDYPRDQYEVIMVENNSTDRSTETVRQHPEIHLLSERRQGAYAARNRGITSATGTIIAFTDPDCVPSRRWLLAIAESMEGPDVQLLLGRGGLRDDSWSLSALSDYEAERAAYIFSGGQRDLYFGYCNNMAVRRTVFDRVGLFPELQRGGDTILVHRVIAAYSTSAVQYRSSVRIQHLEVDTAWKWFRKMRVYGRSGRHYGRVVVARPLNTRERLHVFRATVRGGEYSILRSSLLLVLLVVGVVFYELGRWFPGEITTGAHRES
jgi:glycosyltransferase involved in cell wall biosynthesis